MEVVKETVNELQGIAESKGVKIVTEGDNTFVFGVRRLLYEIVFNLCDNAVKYTNHGGKVTIEVKDKALIVSDTGIGISPEHHDRIFERFYRVDKSHSKQSGGTGITVAF